MENRCGCFSSFREIAEEERKLFEETLRGFVGVGRTPLAVATQVVNGTNYAFLCDSQLVIPDAVHYNDLVIIYKPLNGEPILKEVKEVKIL